jgi:IS30 family transposase
MSGYEQRCQIEVLKNSGFSQQRIADAVDSDQSAISKELPRPQASAVTDIDRLN